MNLNNDFSKIDECEYFELIDISKYSTIKLKAVGNIVIVKTIEALEKSIKLLNEKKIKFLIVGWGANQVLVNTESVVLIKLSFEFDRSSYGELLKEYTFPASAPLTFLTSLASKYGLKGWEVFTGIPASVGGAVYMNAGTALGEIGSLVKSIKVLDENLKIKTIRVDQNSFSYRKNNIVKSNEVILEVTMIHQGSDENIKEKIKEYLNYRKTTQPLSTKNCGCVFKNYDQNHKAGQFIDVCGLKGLTSNGLRVSHQHANFIENTTEADGNDFLGLIDVLKYELELFSGIEFELEAKVY